MDYELRKELKGNDEFIMDSSDKKFIEEQRRIFDENYSGNFYIKEINNYA